MLTTKGKVKNLLEGLRLSSRTEMINSFYDLINTESSTLIEEYRGLDTSGLLNAVINSRDIDPEDWKASYTVAFPSEGVLVEGQVETNGDFETEESTYNMVGIAKTVGKDDRTTVISSSKFKPTGGSTLEGIEISAAGNIYDFNNSTWTYKYEEDPTATGSDPMYLHDFTINLESTQINGYIVIGADDSVIAGNIEGFTPSTGGGGGGSCDLTLNFNIGLTTDADPTQFLIGVSTLDGKEYYGALEIKSIEGSTVATSYAGPGKNLNFFMPSADQSASDTYEYVLTLNEDTTGCTYCASSAISGTITLILDAPQLSEIANNDPSGEGCGSLNPSPPSPPDEDEIP